MKTSIIIVALASSWNLAIHSQDGKIRENISKANENKGIEYFADGSVKSVINISKVEFYY